MFVLNIKTTDLSLLLPAHLVERDSSMENFHGASLVTHYLFKRQGDQTFIIQMINRDDI